MAFYLKFSLNIAKIRPFKIDFKQFKFLSNIVLCLKICSKT
nr:MAG TPA: hypothetical protein [Caudoviricetes sp.]